MCVEISSLAHQEEDQAGVVQAVSDFWVRLVELRPIGRRGPVYPVCEIRASQEPVMRRVAEDVEDRHRGIGEAVDEERLELTLDEVGSYEDHGEGLQGSSWLVACRGRVVDVRAEEVDEGVEEDRSRIFDEVDCRPGDLRSCGECMSVLIDTIEH